MSKDIVNKLNIAPLATVEPGSTVVLIGTEPSQRPFAVVRVAGPVVGATGVRVCLGGMWLMVPGSQPVIAKLPENYKDACDLLMREDGKIRLQLLASYLSAMTPLIDDAIVPGDFKNAVDLCMPEALDVDPARGIEIGVMKYAEGWAVRVVLAQRKPGISPKFCDRETLLLLKCGTLYAAQLVTSQMTAFFESAY